MRLPPHRASEKSRGRKKGIISSSQNTQETDASFEELVQAGNFTYVNPSFKQENDFRWANEGDRIRGHLELVRMGRGYREEEAIAKVAEVSGRRVATAHELAFYASNGWNGTDTVVAFGSSCTTRPSGYRDVAYLWGRADARELGLLWANGLWCEPDFVLCICE